MRTSAAEERDFHVLIDEVYLDLAPPERVRPAARLSPRIVATGSLTKSFGLGGLRIGWVLADPETAELLRRLNDLFTVVIAHPSERLGLMALEHAEDILETRRMMVVVAPIPCRPESPKSCRTGRQKGSSSQNRALGTGWTLRNARQYDGQTASGLIPWPPDRAMAVAFLS